VLQRFLIITEVRVYQVGLVPFRSANTRHCYDFAASREDVCPDILDGAGKTKKQKIIFFPAAYPKVLEAWIYCSTLLVNNIRCPCALYAPKFFQMMR